MFDPDDLATVATQALFEQLEFLHGPGRCVLVVDPSLRPIDTSDPVWARYAKGPVCPVPIHHPRVGRAHWPVLLPLVPSSKTDAALIRHTVAEACAELSNESLSKGRGRRIGGWLTSEVPIERVATHLGRMMVREDPWGSSVWLRLQDPAVLWAVDTLITTNQRAALLGPIGKILTLTPVGELLVMGSYDEDRRKDALDFSMDQWIGFECIEALNAALREGRALTRPHHLAVAREVGYAAMRRARRLGYCSTPDLSHFARLALNVHPFFDRHRLLTARLSGRQPGESFANLVADFNDDHWAQVANETLPLKSA